MESIGPNLATLFVGQDPRWPDLARSSQKNSSPRSLISTPGSLFNSLDDAWNDQNVEVFRARHKPDVIVRWPGKTEPTVGIDAHTEESIEFWKTFPDQRLVNQPYRIFFASGDYTCSVARFTGTMKGPMKLADGTVIPPTGKSFDIDFLTVAQWDNGQIVEENLMYDLVTFMKQIGLGG